MRISSAIIRIKRTRRFSHGLFSANNIRFLLDSSPLQYLPNIPGYVPVYIRYGDEPLEEINADLAEAFGETSNSVKVLKTIMHLNMKNTDSYYYSSTHSNRRNVFIYLEPINTM